MTRLIMGVLVVFIAMTGIPADADARKGKTRTVTITNLTSDQIMSPAVVIVADKDFRLFHPGEPASPELAALAEDAENDALIAYLNTLPSVFAVYELGGPIVPGGSVEVEIETKGRYRYLTLAGMLVTTNDAFYAVQGVGLPRIRFEAVYGNAYDAGSEANSEDCAYIPGPPCGNHVHDMINDAEGFIHIHRGIHGVASLDEAVFDWRNPVVKVHAEK